MQQVRYVLGVLIFVILSGCEPTDLREASIWVICKEQQEICDATHSGAMCTIPRTDAIRTMAIFKTEVSSINAYEALNTLDKYQSCLEDAYVSESVRRKKDKQSQINTIRKIPELQRDIIEQSKSLVRPEVNLWLWQRSRNDDYVESMRNGVEIAEEVHIDVYVGLMMVAAEKSPEEARKYAKMALKKASIIADIQPRIYEFYVGYYLDKEDVHKAAVWQGLYSARDAQQAQINEDYFKIYRQMSKRQIQKAQDEVEGLLFDAKWLNKKMSAFPKNLI